MKLCLLWFYELSNDFSLIFRLVGHQLDELSGSLCGAWTSGKTTNQQMRGECLVNSIMHVIRSPIFKYPEYPKRFLSFYRTKKCNCHPKVVEPYHVFSFPVCIYGCQYTKNQPLCRLGKTKREICCQVAQREDGKHLFFELSVPWLVHNDEDTEVCWGEFIGHMGQLTWVKVYYVMVCDYQMVDV